MEALKFESNIIIPSKIVYKSNILRLHVEDHRAVNERLDWFKNFRELVLSNVSEEFKLSDMNIGEYWITREVKNSQIMSELWEKQEETVFFTYDQVVVLFDYIRRSENTKYKSGHASILYFMHNNVLYCAYCDGLGGKFRNYCLPAKYFSWTRGNRIFTPIQAQV